MIKLWDVHLNEVNLLAHAIRSDRFESGIQNFFLLFVSASIQLGLWLIVTTLMSSHLLPLRLKCSSTSSLNFFCHYVRTSVVNCVLNVLLRANFATGDIDAVVCTTSRVDQYFASTTRNRASKTARVGFVLAKKVSGVWTSLKSNCLKWILKKQS